jgi:hypothetical protein
VHRVDRDGKTELVWKIKLWNKPQALELLGRHQGLFREDPRATRRMCRLSRCRPRRLGSTSIEGSRCGVTTRVERLANRPPDTRTLYELATSSGKTAEQLIREGGLTNEAIRSAPGMVWSLPEGPQREPWRPAERIHWANQGRHWR